MKNPDRVAELLAELRELADNDFERHRIDVLERDLTNPPTVEVIDDIHQWFDGIVYSPNASGHYARGSFLHRVVWSYCNGEIPDGYVIHHIDENKANNHIKNLQCLSVSEHTHCHGAPFVEKICLNCNGKFTVSSKNARRKYCSRSCYWEHMKTLGIEKICPICGKKFKVSSKRQNAVYCSNSCKGVAATVREERICVVCGAKFSVKPSVPTLCCSISCGNKLAWQKTRRQRKS